MKGLNNKSGFGSIHKAMTFDSHDNSFQVTKFYVARLINFYQYFLCHELLVLTFDSIFRSKKVYTYAHMYMGLRSSFSIPNFWVYNL